MAPVGDSRGFTLVDMMLTMAGMVVLVAITGTLVVSAARTEPRLTERTEPVRQARDALERITRELRQATEVHRATSNELVMTTYARTAASPDAAVRRGVRYYCGSGYCTRWEDTPATAEASAEGTSAFPGSGERVVAGLPTSSIFTFDSATDTEYIGVRFAWDVAGTEDRVVIEDGVAPRGTINFLDDS